MRPERAGGVKPQIIYLVVQVEKKAQMQEKGTDGHWLICHVSCIVLQSGIGAARADFAAKSIAKTMDKLDILENAV